MTPPSGRTTKPKDKPVDVADVARQAREASGGARVTIAGILRDDGILRVVGGAVGPVGGAFRRASELARPGERPIVVELDTGGNARVHTDPDGNDAPVDVELDA